LTGPSPSQKEELVTTEVPVLDRVPTERSRPFDPPAQLIALAAEGPIHRMRYPGGRVGWLVTGYAAVRAVLADVRFSSRVDLLQLPAPVVTEPVQPRPPAPGVLTQLDPPQHTRLRRLLVGQFTVRRMNMLVERIRQITDEQLNRMEQAGSPVDLVDAFALPIPSLVICELLGVPYGDRGHFQRSSAVLADTTSTREQIRAATGALVAFLHQLVADKRTEPDEHLLSGLIAAGELNDEELTNIGLTLLVAGHETTANMLALGAFALLEHPDQAAAMRAADDDAAAQAVEEMLRYLSIIHIGPVRTALVDIAVEGQLIKAGEPVTVSVPAADWDPERFPEPHRLDIGRRATGHVAFGHGVHQCLGQQLARIEMQVGYPALLRRFPGLRLDVDPQEIALREQMLFYGVHRLPVAW
jgi:cytochrome P450